MSRTKKATVYYPSEYEKNNYVGPLYGYFFKNSNHYNIVNNFSISNDLNNIGYIYKNKEDIPEIVKNDWLIGYYKNEKLLFFQNKKQCNNNPYSLTLNIFSRNTGILETSKMLDKSVIISGCGSVGSLVALELARSGVGKFLLIDNDIFEYHNICRHQCGVIDVGKYKVDAIEEKILNINPKAQVVKQYKILERVPKAIFDNFINKNTIIIGCADNRAGDLYANKLSYLYNIPFISIGFWERAFAGEIFYSIPKETSCYCCQFGDLEKEQDARVNANHRFYIDEQELEKVHFEPGISIDINFVTIIGIKLIIDILNKGSKEYIPKVINNLSQYTLVCNTNDTRIGGDLAEIFSYPLQITTSIEVPKKINCPICGQV